MGKLLQIGYRFIADALRWTVGRDQVGVLVFQLLQLLHQLVVFEIADFRSREHVIFTVVFTNLLSKCFDLLGDRLNHDGVTPRCSRG